jgi:hypothetical protein
MSEVWSRLLQGGPVLVLGGSLPWPPPRPDVVTVRVRTPDPSGLPPLEVALRALAASQPAAQPFWARAAARRSRGVSPRWRAMQEDPHQGVLADLHHAATAIGAPVVIVVDLVGPQLDPSLQVAFSGLVNAASRPAFGLAICVPEAARSEAVQRWVDAVREHIPESVHEGTVAAVLDPARLDEPLARAVRALCVLGPSCSSRGLAAVLGEPRVRVLELLQRAADLGVPLEDRGDDELRIEPAFAEAWRARTLPSLASAWQGAWRTWLDLRPPTEVPDAEPSAPEPLVVETPVEPAAPEAEAQPAAAEPTEAAWQPTFDRLLRAWRTTAESDPHRALEVARAALQLLDRVGPPARTTRAAFLGEVANLQWSRSGQGEAFVLSAALNTIDAALQSLQPDDPPELCAGLRAIASGICHDLGDARSLDRALDELVQASRRWQEAGKPVEAARLLNDQAAIWLRSGDTVRAAHLLRAAREAFSADAPTDETARWEAAETDLLLARLALRTPARGDLQADAWLRARQHAQDAADTFGQLGDPRRRERAREVAARIALATGDAERAVAELTEVARNQARLDDAVGLARTAEAMTVAYLRLRRVDAALATLSDSITLNARKGSPLGLAYDERALRAVAEAADHTKAQALQVLAARLQGAQERWGRVELG